MTCGQNRFCARGLSLAGLCVSLILVLSPVAVAQFISNGNFEGGFNQDGVALDWDYQNSSPHYPGYWADGTDYVHEGSHSQKFVMVEPVTPVDNGSLYMWQTFYCVPGQEYTVDVWIRSQQGGEGTPGTLLTSYVGLDPEGGSYIHSFDIEWHELSNTRNTWIHESHSVTANGCFVTLFIRAYRKSPTGGDGAVWFDQATISGPTNTNPSPTLTPTITPTPSIPAPIGSDLITNGDFENGFSSGVGQGWSSWSTNGSGYWKQSSLLGKVGIGHYGSSDGWFDECVAARPKSILLCQTWGAADEIADEPSLADTLVVGRQVIDDRYGDIHAEEFEEVADDLVDKYWTELQYHPRIDAWCGLNEPGWSEEHGWKYVEFERVFAEKMHERGLKTVAFNWGVGSPGDMNVLLDCQPAHSVVDYLGYHPYGCQVDTYLVTNIVYDDPYDWALRGVRMAALLQGRGHRLPPMLYTENAPHAGPDGWHGELPDAMVRDDYIAFMGYLNDQPYCVGSHIWLCGWFGSWEGYEITGHGIAAPLGNEALDAPADAVSGQYSQQFGAGTLHGTTSIPTPEGNFTGGLCQAVSGLSVGETYLLLVDAKYEFNWGRPGPSFQTGIDWTGQTTNGNASTINWSVDRFAQSLVTHERFYTFRHYVTAQASSASVWIRGSQSQDAPSWRISIDRVRMYQVSGTPPPTNTPAPTDTPVSSQGLLNGDMEGGFTSGTANEWTSFCTNGSATFSDGTDVKHGGAHAQKMVYPQPSGGGFAGIYQVVPCSPSQNATLSAWKYDQLSGSDPWAFVCRLGYDLTGGTDPQSGNVVWSEFDCTPHQTWISKQVQFTTTGSSVTVFVEGWHKGWGGTHTAWFDDVDLDGIGGPPPATNTPVATDTPAAAATSTPTALPPSGGLVNGDMEDGFTSGVANDWSSFCTNGSPTFSDGTDQKHGGSHSQKIVYPQPSGAGYAGIYQVVDCSSGQNGTLTAWKYDQLSGGDPYALVCRLGYDLSGGTNPQSGNVVWGEFNCTPHQSWISKQVQFTTTGSSVTVFVEAWHKGWGGTHTAWFDDVSLDGIGGPPPAATPTPTPGASTPTPACPGESLASLTNMSFQTSWSYDPAPNDPAGWEVLDWTAGGPQYYTGYELSNGKPSDHRCKYELGGGSTGTDHVIAKEIEWGSVTSVDVSVYCAGRKWDGWSNGTMSIGVDLDGCADGWSDADQVQNRTSNNESWSQISLANLSRPAGASTFTLMLRANRSGPSWNCQFDEASAVESGTARGPIRPTGRYTWNWNPEHRAPGLSLE